MDLEDFLERDITTFLDNEVTFGKEENKAVEEDIDSLLRGGQAQKEHDEKEKENDVLSDILSPTTEESSKPIALKTNNITIENEQAQAQPQIQPVILPAQQASLSITTSKTAKNDSQTTQVDVPPKVSDVAPTTIREIVHDHDPQEEKRFKELQNELIEKEAELKSLQQQKKNIPSQPATVNIAPSTVREIVREKDPQEEQKNKELQKQLKEKETKLKELQDKLKAQSRRVHESRHKHHQQPVLQQ